MKYEVEEGIELPPSRKESEKYPFDTMEVGASFFVHCPVEEQLRKANNVSSACNQRCKRYKEEKYTVRKVNKDGIIGVRVWRIK